MLILSGDIEPPTSSRQPKLASCLPCGKISQNILARLHSARYEERMYLLPERVRDCHRKIKGRPATERVRKDLPKKDYGKGVVIEKSAPTYI